MAAVAMSKMDVVALVFEDPAYRKHYRDVLLSQHMLQV